MKKAIFTLALFLFILSGTSLVLLTLEDKKDLSGRAYEVVPTEYTELLEKLNKNKPGNEAVMDGIGKVELHFDPTEWKLMDDKKLVFWNIKGGYSARLLATGATISEMLGENYTNIKKTGESIRDDGWKVEKYSAMFLAKEKEVNVWSRNDAPWSAVVIGEKGADKEATVSLVSSVTLSKNDNKKVKGDMATDESAKVTSLTRPSVVMIFDKFCSNLTISRNDPDVTLAGKNYPFCFASTGSGFFISEDGHVATNGHVVRMADPALIIYGGIIGGQLDPFMIDAVVSGLRSMGVVPDMAKVKAVVAAIKENKQDALQMTATILDLQNKGIVSVHDDSYKYYVQLSKTPIKVNSSGNVNLGDDIVEATLVGYDYDNIERDGSFHSSDVAILKVKGSGYPALPLGDLEGLSQGASLEVIGFPGVVAGGEGSILDSSASSEPTVTRGVVSAIKYAKGDKKKLVQTDASINHGNSGGPAVDMQGRVIGIATYGMSVEDGSGNYNFLRDVADLKALAAKHNVKTETGKTYDKWKSGLNNFWVSYYRYAKEDFEDVAKYYPVHPMVNQFIGDAKSKIGTSADLTPMFSKSQRNALKVVAGLVMVMSLAAMAGAGVWNKVAAAKVSY